MSDSTTKLTTTARVLENLFFYAENRILVDELKRLRREEESIEALAGASNVADREVLSSLVKLDVRPETVAALCLVPVVEVAWADGAIDAREIEAFIKGAEKTGDRASVRILHEWLRKKPDASLLTAWKEYVKGLCSVMDATAHARLCDDIIEHATAVARASGGFLGLGDPVSPQERKILGELKAFLIDTPVCGDSCQAR